MGDMTDFDKIIPQAVGKVNGKCPIKRTVYGLTGAGSPAPSKP